MKFLRLAINTAVSRKQEEINYDCAVDCINDLMRACANEIEKEEELALPSLPKIAALLSTTTALARESKGLRVTDYARVAFIRQTFETRLRAYHAFRAEVEFSPASTQ